MIENIAHMHRMNQDFEKINERCYDNCASMWDRFPFPEDLPLLVERYSNISSGKRVLDIGSGTGVLAKWLAETGYDVICLDPSSEMVKRCREKGLQTTQCTIQSFQWEGEPFTMIFAILSLIHLPKEAFSHAIMKISDMLPSNGVFFLAMLEGEGEGVNRNSPYPRFFAYYTQKEIETKVSAVFSKMDYRFYRSGNIGYMLFTFMKK